MRAMEDAGIDAGSSRPGRATCLLSLRGGRCPEAVVRAVGSPDEARAVADEVRREQDDF